MYRFHQLDKNILLLLCCFFPGPITNASIQLDFGFQHELADRDNFVLTILGITTGSQATQVTWRRNGVVVNRNTIIKEYRTYKECYFPYFDGGGEATVGTGPCERRMYRVALLVVGYYPGSYMYTVSNANTSRPVTSPVFVIQGIVLSQMLAILL